MRNLVVGFLLELRYVSIDVGTIFETGEENVALVVVVVELVVIIECVVVVVAVVDVEIEDKKVCGVSISGLKSGQTCCF